VFTSGCEAIEDLPSGVRVNAFDFKIEKWEPAAAERARRYGECSIVDQIIRIRTDFSSPEKAADTLLHELSHAIWWAHGIDDADAEERTVNLTTTGWTALYRNNPWLLTWLSRCLSR
jgi:hypothetical protein